MSLQQRIQTDIATAMRGGDALRRDVLRMASSAAHYAEKRNGRPLTDDEFLAVLAREVKTRHESVEAFRGGRSGAGTSRMTRAPRSMKRGAYRTAMSASPKPCSACKRMVLPAMSVCAHTTRPV